MTGACAANRGRSSSLRGQQALRPHGMELQRDSGMHCNPRRRLLYRLGHVPREFGRPCRDKAPDFELRFYQDTPRETKQTAFFGSADVDLIPKVLTLTVGTRHFLFENSYKGSVMSSFGCYEAGVLPGGCTSSFSYNLDAQNLQGSESGFKSRANITWHVTPDAMVYYTWSQGFRPGGFDENGGTGHIFGTDGQLQYLLPRSWDSDKLYQQQRDRLEDRVFSIIASSGMAAIYRENWDNVQISLLRSGLARPNLFFNTQLRANFLVKGLDITPWSPA